ncbi:hypothetical protein DYU05_06235 [Mucilaginibacter terrenus]|uniref:Uncharacterized protein n=1 Tax=Mucilaginibacter terrenus TaxID=2482727 RepID=A0A3E2NVZ9_9SPHI|nr:hypothetical protein [Mucilaginibacter terrenus]RFZ85196.1 hypothetical protein DYU05_06235 [Mucilaginibacter terrenus]
MKAGGNGAAQLTKFGGWNHAHPGNSGPSPDDVFLLIENLSQPDLVSTGATAIKYYRDSASITVVTSQGNYVVTVKDWGKLQAAYERFSDDPGGFDDEYRDFAGIYLQQYATANGSASIYALSQLLGASINVYREDRNLNGGSYYPVKNTGMLITPLNCQ